LSKVSLSRMRHARNSQIVKSLGKIYVGPLAL
jgi:hypothetical protein